MTAATFSTEGDVGILTLNKSTTQPLGRGLLDAWKTSVDQACRSGIRALVVWAGESARLGQTEAMIATGARAKEYLMTSDLIPATEAARMGLINHAVPADELDARVEQRASSMLDASLGNEPLTNYTDNHRKAVAAFSNKRKPVFGAS
jgi:enoyl-CoA hydratase/carnithine racemase